LVDAPSAEQLLSLPAECNFGLDSSTLASLGDKVALKIIPRGRTYSCSLGGRRPNFTGAVQREVAAARRLAGSSLRHVIPPLALLCDHQEWQLLMRALPGARSISQAVRGRPSGMQVRPALLLFKQVLLGLQELHSREILHLDLSDNNVLLAEGPGGTQQAFIIDLGSSALLGPARPMGSVAMSPTFRPPELLLDPHAAPSRAMDVWAAVCLLGCLVSGHSPRAHQPSFHPLRFMGRQQLSSEEARPFTPEDVQRLTVRGGQFERLVRRGWAQDPSHRATLEELLQTTEQCLQQLR
jgi:serine/threonine protein kinase